MPNIAGLGKQKAIEEIMEESQAKANESKRNTGELGKNDFLQLLITQVQHQDPLNPSSDTDFIAQMAQFSSLEQMQNLNRTFAYQSGMTMMGKYISADITDPVTGDTKYIDGIVESVRILNGEVHAVVAGNDVPLDKISRVFDGSTSPDGNVMDYSSIIGLLASANIMNTEGRTSSVEGIISSVIKENDGIYAKLDEVDIKPYRLDLGAFESEEEYVTYMAGQVVELTFEDELTGEKYTVEGILRSGYEDQGGEVRLLLDDVKMPVGSIYSTRKIDLLSTEQMLLNQILKELQKQQGPDESEEPLPDDSEEESEISDLI